MLKENQLFWTPMYNSALLEHWIMLVRRNIETDSKNTNVNLHENAKKSKIFICTTMYRENEREMKQLLESYKFINKNVSRAKGLRFQIFIIFDNAVKAGKPTKYLLQLVVLMEEVFGSPVLKSLTKTDTPYGMSLSLRLPDGADDVIPCTIYLKDKTKVKSKKRWSQVMYIKYILEKEIQDYRSFEKSYILTTDADVKFTPKSVEALLDLMTRDYSVGAVCARTHPLGSGVLVWYQIFEYAIGHWFLKATEHVLGTVLCAPGCFSVYRCRALKDVFDKYATDVEKAEEFLTKDMGEDRWLCTLLVQNGWSIEYCATASDCTYCPESFDELFKQRRRWIVSTLANQWLLIKEWNLIAENNLRVCFLFNIYQIVMLVSTLIAPSSVILVVSGGLKYGNNLNTSATLLVQVFACLFYAVVCLCSSQKTQLMVGKLFSCLYTIIMVIVFVGTVVEIATDIKGAPGAEGNFISEDLRISTTSVYCIGMACLFFITAVLHLTEFWTIFYGLIYLLGLPSSYLILMIYSICNITDRSWGTRDDAQSLNLSNGPTWREHIQNVLKHMYSCCKTQGNSQEILAFENPAFDYSTSNASLNPPGIIDDNGTNDDTNNTFMLRGEDDEPVGTWLVDMPDEARILKMNGFEKTSFISGITRDELKSIGIHGDIQLSKIMKKVDSLKDFEIQLDIPDNVESWLRNIDLEHYKDNFDGVNLKVKEDLEMLANCNINAIVKSVNMTKKGHIRRLHKAIKRLQNPSKAQIKLMEALDVIENMDSSTVFHEAEFCEKFRKEYLIPRSNVSESDAHLKGKLQKLRNNWLIIFALINIMWLTLIATLAYKGKLLGVFGSDPVGFAVVVVHVYGVILVIQFLAMIVHRLSTLLYYLGIIPYKFNTDYYSSWVFHDRQVSIDQADENKLKRSKYRSRRK